MENRDTGFISCRRAIQDSNTAFNSVGPNVDWISIRPRQLPESVVVSLINANHAIKMATSHSLGSNLVEVAQVLEPNEYLSSGEFVFSPSGEYKVGLTSKGDLTLQDHRSNLVWSAGITYGDRCFMQTDGNLVVRDGDNKVLWASHTSENPGARFIINNVGCLAIMKDQTPLWTAELKMEWLSAQTAPQNAITPQISFSAAIVLEPGTFLSQGQFVSSPSGFYKVGLSMSGSLVLLGEDGSNPVWSSGIAGGHRCYMQGDGNLLVRDTDQKQIWASHTSNNRGARFVISDSGRIAVLLDETSLWDSVPHLGSSLEELGPSPTPSLHDTTSSIEEATILESGTSLPRGQFVSSRSGAYNFGLSNRGDLVMRDHSSNEIWSAGINNGQNCFMQDDGNLIVRDGAFNKLWDSKTSNNHGARLIVDDAGRIAVVHGSTPLWMDGAPRGTYNRPPSSENLQFPIRGIFYYPWYPETWTVNGKQARFEPKLGFYNSGDPHVAEAHIDAMDYAWVDLSIASWWGPNTNLDKARITLLMDETIALNSQLRWTIYHEDERLEDASVAKLQDDLDYLKKWFAWHPAWAHIDRRPVIFVYNEGDCEVAERWMSASAGKWYVVLKLFKDFDDCPVQPDHWHQYGPADAEIHLENYSYSISPGFWLADEEEPRLPRVRRSEWRHHVECMVGSGEPWQLITTFNEAGEGTMIEPSQDWDSSSGYGSYLDSLHGVH
jgi:hypothetical protein